MSLSKKLLKIQGLAKKRLKSLSDENGYRYGFNGKESDVDFGNGDGNVYDYGARMYNAQIAKFLSVDPLIRKHADYTPFAFVYNNPLNLIDPDGRDSLYFNADGTYSHFEEFPGKHAGRVLGDDGYVFNFADPIHDPQDIKKGYITRIQKVSDEFISEKLTKSGVYDLENKINKETYILKESSITSSQTFGSGGSGKMDYAQKYEITIDGRTDNITGFGETLFMTKTKSGNIAHNAANFGNFLWGAGANELGFPLWQAKAGAHSNSWKNEGELDSPDDQFSIEIGFEWKKTQNETWSPTMDYSPTTPVSNQDLNRK